MLGDVIEDVGSSGVVFGNEPKSCARSFERRIELFRARLERRRQAMLDIRQSSVAVDDDCAFDALGKFRARTRNPTTAEAMSDERRAAEPCVVEHADDIARE